jgi:GDP-mannose 6-dehydrogenase
MLRELYGSLPCEFVTTSIGVAEIQKYACNAFHALKITFANEIARISEAAGVDGRSVMELICKDQRLNISAAYMKPGFAFGGSCLPKDLRAIAYLAKISDVTIPMLSSVMGSNRAHIDHVLSKVMAPDVRRVAIIGLSFKAGTDDLRESPMVTVAERLLGKGYELRIYDPEVNLSRLIGANKRYIETSIPHIGNLMVGNCAEAIAGADVVITGLGGEAILRELSASVTPEQIVVDIVGLPRDRLNCKHYAGACW